MIYIIFYRHIKVNNDIVVSNLCNHNSSYAINNVITYSRKCRSIARLCALEWPQISDYSLLVPWPPLNLPPSLSLTLCTITPSVSSVMIRLVIIYSTMFVCSTKGHRFIFFTSHYYKDKPLKEYKQRVIQWWTTHYTIYYCDTFLDEGVVEKLVWKHGTLAWIMFL